MKSELMLFHRFVLVEISEEFFKVLFCNNIDMYVLDYLQLLLVLKGKIAGKKIEEVNT